MYEGFFQLHARPFLPAPRVDRYFPAAAIERARQNLSRLVERGEGPGLVVGPAGSGKSLLCQVLAEQHKTHFQIAHFSSARLCTRRALLQAILYELNLPYRDMEEGELRLSLIDHLTATPSPRPYLLFLVDEAHALPLRLLEEIRMITNLVRDGQPCVRLVLAGAPALEERFASPKLESFNQRIAARCYLESFDHHDTYQYVCAQITACGGQAHELFADDAFEAIYRATDGVPRLVNQLCDHALVLAHAGGARKIDGAGIEEAWADLQQLPLPWVSKTREQVPTQGVVEFGALDEEPEEASFAAHQIEDEEDEPTALPFPIRARQGDALESLDQIEQQLCELEEDFEPVGSIRPQSAAHVVSANPFDEDFEEEEVVLDPYAVLDERLLRGRQRVASLGGDRISELLMEHVVEVRPAVAEADEDQIDTTLDVTEQMVAEVVDDFDPVLPEEADEPLPVAMHRASAPAAPHMLPQPEEAWDDRDLIVVEEEAAPLEAGPRVRRQDYRQLFARLRQG